MKPELFGQLADIPRLDKSALREQSIDCKICGAQSQPFDVVDLNKCCSKRLYLFGMSGISVPYYRCVDCGFIFTSFFDDWSLSDFSKFIYNDDYVYVDPDYLDIRPRQCAADVAKFLPNSTDISVLDYGSGAGVFAKALRQNTGINTTSYDPFSSPARPVGLFDLVTCFEVIEHSANPVETMKDVSSFLHDDALAIVGTSIQPNDIELIRANWWYIAPRNGHVSIFTRQALAILAEKSGLVLLSTPQWHGFSLPHASPATLKGCAKRIKTVILKAPMGESDEWNGMEKETVQYRWSRTDRLHWKISETADIFLLIIPFFMQIRPDYAEQCMIFCNGNAFPVTVRDDKIFCEISPGPDFDGILELRTSPLIRPSENGRSQDERLLGIAILV